MRYIAMSAATVAAAGALLAGTSTGALAQSGSSPQGAVARPVATTAAPAKAAPAAAYDNACGAGYRVIDHLTIASKGTVYLTYNASNGYNCVVTVRDVPGARLAMRAYVEPAQDPSKLVNDYGQYTTYAGPVYLHAPGQCINWGGMISWSEVGDPDSHCG